MKRRLSPAVAFWALTAVAAAQTVNMGSPPYFYDEHEGVVTVGEQTFVDLTRPASASGTIATAWLGWSASPCPAAVKIKVLRRKAEMLLFVAERGPFDVITNEFGFTSVTLEPPIEVSQGDLIGLSRVSDCFGPLIYPNLSPGPHDQRPTEGLARFDGDLTSDVAFSAGDIEAAGFFLGVSASGPATEQVASVLPVAGSTPGAFSSYFRTAVQLSNPWSQSISGRLVFHAAGATSSPDDPSLPFTVDPVSTFFDEDIVAAMGRAGVGTLDVVVGVSSNGPLITARVYADSEEGGTFGFTEEAVDPSFCCGKVLSIGSSGYLVAPSDPRRFRFNIGVRALFKAPTITFRVLGPGGTTLREATRSYPPSTFWQEPAEALFGAPLSANAQIAVEVSAGTAIVYGAAVDNVTNDPSIQFVP
jgi:hypothetical protein